jgi:hypothetical protein
VDFFSGQNAKIILRSFFNYQGGVVNWLLSQPVGLTIRV